MMRLTLRPLRLAFVALGVLALAACTSPQPATSEPSAANVLPRPAPPFAGTIGRTAAESKPDFPKAIEAPKGAPNVLLILTDDVGFGASSTFGGAIPTPTFDRLAQAGLRYNTFHTTALCSPTRSSIITGRNHHTNATGVITEMGTGYPGYNSLMPKSSGTVGEILKQNGYNTAWFGKNHNVPDWQTSRRDRSTCGQRAWASITSTASSAATPTNGIPLSSKARSRSRPRSRGRQLDALRRADGEQGHRVDSTAEFAGPGQAVLRLLRAGPHPGTAPRAQRVDGEVQGPVRPGLGKVREETFARQKKTRRRAGQREAHAAAEGNPGVGFAERRLNKSFSADMMEVYAASLSYVV